MQTRVIKDQQKQIKKYQKAWEFVWGQWQRPESDEKPRPGQKPKLSGRDEAMLTAIACSDPPEGYGRWTIRLLADKLVELGVVDSISRETVRKTLKKNELKPWLRKQWCIGNIDWEFLARMEDILDL